MAGIDSVSSSRETISPDVTLKDAQVVEEGSRAFETLALLNPRLSRVQLRRAREHFLGAVHTLVELDRLARSLPAPRGEGEEQKL